MAKTQHYFVELCIYTVLAVYNVIQTKRRPSFFSSKQPCAFHLGARRCHFQESQSEEGQPAHMT